jgi:hypothetical protein
MTPEVFLSRLKILAPLPAGAASALRRAAHSATARCGCGLPLVVTNSNAAAVATRHPTRRAIAFHAKCLVSPLEYNTKPPQKRPDKRVDGGEPRGPEQLGAHVWSGHMDPCEPSGCDGTLDESVSRVGRCFM